MEDNAVATIPGGSHNDFILGTALNDVISSGSGNDTILGLDGKAQGSREAKCCQETDPGRKRELNEASPHEKAPDHYQLPLSKIEYPGTLVNDNESDCH